MAAIVVLSGQVRKHPNDLKSNGFYPNQQPHVIEKTAASEVCLSVSNNEKKEGERESEKSKDEVDVISSRLEEILFVSQEPKLLSEEQLRVNGRLQEEEIQAMEAIYGENFIVLDRQDGLRSFQIYIHIDVPSELIVYTKIGSCDGEVEFSKLGSETIATPVNSNESFKVQYLPPILLTCLLSKAYPSHSAPCFTISVQWLDAMRISSLCKMLDTIWTDQSGQEIVYPWADWIQNSSLSYLEFGNRIPLTASFGKVDNAGDRRAISESVSPDVDTRTRFVKLPCKHFFCRNCMVTYSTMQAKEGGAILCPQIKCSELVPPGLIKSLLGDETFEQWESLLFHKTLDSMSDIVYCPRCDMACLEDEDHLAQCTECFFTFCSRCRDKLHVGVPCMTLEEKLEFLQNRQPAQSGQPIMTKQQLKELDRIRINVYVNEQEIKRIAKKCPNCSMAIFK
ncbi:E3 ubiquitin-protein ligase RNF14-like [Papaver somniferum]|uniref:E3 ubiquitin-protein ligase RNF14-like n=1 Tax=Papaver somniferum TaxID=3469 RepID=UPI000E6FF753|nr:E3 ubiquitin-protein ligase RNF14-like [Papaver somniferum]